MNAFTSVLKSNQLEKNTGDVYLSLKLNSQTPAVLPMEQTQEVLTVPTQRITFMPNMPDCVIGLLNQRSRVLWMVDLPNMLDFATVDQNTHQYNVVIVRVDNTVLALAVQEIKGVIRLKADAIQSPIGTVSPGLTPYLRGCIPQSSEVLLILDPQAIVSSPILHGSK